MQRTRGALKRRRRAPQGAWVAVRSGVGGAAYWERNGREQCGAIGAPQRHIGKRYAEVCIYNGAPGTAELSTGDAGKCNATQRGCHSVGNTTYCTCAPVNQGRGECPPTRSQQGANGNGKLENISRRRVQRRKSPQLPHAADARATSQREYY
jgi:hypothetical protein